MKKGLMVLLLIVFSALIWSEADLAWRKKVDAVLARSGMFVTVDVYYFNSHQGGNTVTIEWNSYRIAEDVSIDENIKVQDVLDYFYQKGYEVFHYSNSTVLASASDFRGMKSFILKKRI